MRYLIPLLLGALLAGAEAPVEAWTPYPPAARMFTAATQLKVWQAGAELFPELVTSVEPVIRDRYNKDTGKRKPPVQAWRCTPGTPAFDLDLGTLPIGCYVLRVVAMVQTADLEQYRKPLYVELSVDDQPGGGTTVYRQRIPYWDEFYAVTETYLNIDEARAYHGQLTVGQGSLPALYIHAVELHDVLAGLPRVAAKQQPGTFSYAERERLRRNVDPAAVWERVRKEVALEPFYQPDQAPLEPAARQARDDLLWNAFPPLNSQFVAEYDEGFFGNEMRADGLTAGQVARKAGTWELPGRNDGWRRPLVFTNRQLNLTYTRADLAAHRPLPDPYPYRDDGMGLWFPAGHGIDHPTHFLALALQLGQRWQSCWSPLAGWHGNEITYRLPYLYHALGSENAARDAALLLARWAWTYPTHGDQQTLGYALISPAGMYHRDMRLRMRALSFYWGSPRGANLEQGLSQSYDFLFDYIKGNQELASAVGRYIPWVRTDADVRRLIETRILQFGARQSELFHLCDSKDHSAWFLRTAVIQQDPAVTRPWLEQLWKKTHIYPHPMAGLPHFLSTTTQRDGTTDIGSVFYTQDGSPFLDTVALSRRYVVNGGDPAFDLTGPAYSAKMEAACAFPFDSTVAGGFPVTIGDVGGPYKPRVFNAFESFETNARDGWEWTRQARYAWLIAHYYGRRGEDDADWQAIAAAAAKLGFNPLLASRSRVLADWAGILESGAGEEDFRLHTALHLRVGTGHGHTHYNTLDLQLIANGVRAVNDVGHRGSYGQPSPVDTMVHNLVEVDGTGGRETNWQGHAWIRTLAGQAAGPPSPRIQYVEGRAVAPGGLLKDIDRNRAVAVITVDPGAPGTADPAPLPYTDKTVFPADYRPALTYVFDVQRVAGGSTHTFHFHGTYSDDFQVNLQDRRTELDEWEQQYLRKYLRGDLAPYMGTAPAVLEATWRLRRSTDPLTAIKRGGDPVTLKQVNAEAQMLGATYRDDAPRLYTRLHLTGHAGERLMVAHIQPTEERVTMTWPFLMVQRQGENLQSVYPSIIEPYRGEPFIRSVHQLDLPGSGADRPVALQVDLPDGRTDICFSDGSPEARQVAGLRVNGRFAWVATEGNGLLGAALIEGALLATPQGTLTLAQPSIEATIAEVDFYGHAVLLDRAWPGEHLVGEQVELGNADHRTSYTIAAVETVDGKTRLTLDKALDLCYAAVTAFDSAKGLVATNVAPTSVRHPGMDAGLTATNGEMTAAFPCAYLGQQGDLANVWRVATPLPADAFPVGSTFRVWQTGPGDTARLTAWARLDRQPDGTLRLESNLPSAWKAR